jgi:hypothetical protein
MSMSNKDRHVVQHDGQWAVRVSGASKVSSIHYTQTLAIKAAIPGSKRDRSEVVIHGRDGKIRDKDSYGNDPCPPKDMKH